MLSQKKKAKMERQKRLAFVERFSIHDTYFMDANWDAAAKLYVETGEITNGLRPDLLEALTAH